MEKLEGLTVSEVGQMLKDCAWCVVKKGWMTETQDRLKLSVLQHAHSIPVHTQLDSPTSTSHPGGNVQTHMHKHICRSLCMYTMKP